MSQTTKTPLTVYTIVARERDQKSFWVRIGAAFRNADGSLNVRLDAVPVNGTMHIREARAFAERDVPMPGEADLVVGSLAQ